MIITYSELPQVKKEAEDTPIFFKTGCFDLFHQGHANMLGFLKSLGGVSVVGVAPDSRVRSRKGANRPIRDQNYRVRDIEDSNLADYVFVTPEGVLGVPRSIRRLQPTAFVEHKLDCKGAHIGAWLKLAGIQYIRDDSLRICSTTEIIAGDNEALTKLLIPDALDMGRAAGRIS